MAYEHHYRVDLAWENDRLGLLSSPDLVHKLPVATPPPFPKGMDGYWSPEHLLTAAVSSCFMTTFLAIAENSKLAFEGFSCVAHGKLEQVEGKYMMSEIIVEPTVTLLNEEDQAKALKILEKTEAACLISNSIKSTVIMQPTVRILKLA